MNGAVLLTALQLQTMHMVAVWQCRTYRVKTGSKEATYLLLTPVKHLKIRIHCRSLFIFVAITATCVKLETQPDGDVHISHSWQKLSPLLWQYCHGMQPIQTNRAMLQLCVGCEEAFLQKQSFQDCFFFLQAWQSQPYIQTYEWNRPGEIKCAKL